MEIKSVAFFGCSCEEKGDPHFDGAYETAKAIARSGRRVVNGGGPGTISEFAMAWGVARLYIDHHKPLLLYGDFWRHLMADFKEHMLIRKEEERVYTIINSSSEVLAGLEKYEEILKKNRHEHKICKGPECSLLL